MDRVLYSILYYHIIYYTILLYYTILTCTWCPLRRARGPASAGGEPAARAPLRPLIISYDRTYLISLI